MLPGLSLAAGDADSWLERMNSALHELSYEGRFVYQHGHNLDAMYLSHEVIDGHERERLLSLNGLPREVIRDDEAVTCIVAGPNAAQIDKRPARRHLAPVQAIHPQRLGGYYRIELGGQERVAGRPAQAISIIPRDDQRYGYRLLLDAEHALPLAAATLDPSGQRISQLLFTELRLDPPVADAPASVADGQTAIERVTPAATPATTAATRWGFSDLPGGFEQTDFRRRLLAHDGQPVEHFIFSDGLAIVSVYVETEHDDGHGAGMSRRGAVTALRRTIPGFQVTAVGEVPQATLQRFLDGIHVAAGAP